jgi:hypothetical protein
MNVKTTKSLDSPTNLNMKIKAATAAKVIRLTVKILKKRSEKRVWFL